MRRRFTRFELWHDRIPTGINCAAAGGAIVVAFMAPGVGPTLAAIMIVVLAAICVVKP